MRVETCDPSVRVKIARRSVDAILIVEFDLSRKQVDGDYRGMATIDGVVLRIARQTWKWIAVMNRSGTQKYPEIDCK